MATDIEKLVVSMSADFKAYENAMAKASGITRKELRQIKADAQGIGTANEKAFNAVARASQGYGKSLTGTAANVVQFRTRVQQASYQIQDFAVQVGSGTAATVALGQQLPQLLGAFGAFGAILGTGVAIGLPLVTAAVRGLRDESIPLEDRMTALKDALAAVKEAAELQSSTIEALTERYGAADAQVRTLIGSISQLAVDQAAQAVRELQQAWSDLASTTVEAPLGLGEGFLQMPDVSQVSNGIETLRERMQVTTAEAERLQAAILDFQQAATIPDAFNALVGILEVIDDTRDATGRLSEGMTAFKQEVTDAADLVGQVRGSTESLAGATEAAAQAAAGLAQAWGSVAQASAQAAQMAAAAKAEAGNRSAPGNFATPAPSPFGGPTDFPLYNPAPQASDFPLYGYGAAAPSGGGGSHRSGGGGSRSGSLDRGNAEQIATQQRAIRDAIQEVAEAQAQLERQNERTAATFADLFSDALTGARSLEDGIAGLAEQIGKLFLQKGFEQILSAGGGGGIFGSLTGLFGGARASGGSVSGGSAYLVGERGPELFVPSLGGMVVPNDKLSGGSAGGSVMVEVAVREDGALQAYVTRTAGDVTARGMAVVRKDVPKIMAETQRRVGR